MSNRSTPVGSRSRRSMVTAEVAFQFVAAARDILGVPGNVANMILMRGFSKTPRLARVRSKLLS